MDFSDFFSPHYAAARMATQRKAHAEATQQGNAPAAVAPGSGTRRNVELF